MENKICIIYTYFNSQSSNYNFNYFVKNELKQSETIDYILVINGFDYHKDITIPILSNVTILKRENKGFDFGGHAHAIKYIKENNKTYDYYFFMNSGVIGPIQPFYLNESSHWSQYFIKKINDTVKLVGTTIVCLPHKDKGGFGPKVEGFFFMTDTIGLDIFTNKKTIFTDHETKEAAILNGEYALSKAIFENGYSIDCMIKKYQGIDWKDSKNHTMNNYWHPSRHESFYGHSLIPYELIFHKWHWHNKKKVNFNIIQQYVEFLT